MPRAVPRIQSSAVKRNVVRILQRLNVVDNRRLPEIADRHREGRADARLAGLAFERLDQRRFLAADVGARAEMDLDVEVEALRAADAGTEQATVPHRLKLRLERLEQVAIFAPKIKEAAGRSYDKTCDCHSLEHALDEGCQQDAVLERAGLALVGVADDVTLGAGRIAAALPFDRSRESCAAAAAQVGAFHFVEHALAAKRNRRPRRRSRLIARAEQGVGASDIVFDPEELRRPIRKLNAAPDEVANFVDTPRGHTGDRPVIDKERRPLVAHAGARRQIHAYRAIGRYLAAN